MINKEQKSVGFKDMHPMQVRALMDFIGLGIELAINTNEEEIIDNFEATCDELIKLFGGVGVKIEIEDCTENDINGSKRIH